MGPVIGIYGTSRYIRIRYKIRYGVPFVKEMSVDQANVSTILLIHSNTICLGRCYIHLFRMCFGNLC